MPPDWRSTAGFYGSFLSHQSVWETVGPNEKVLVLEDDAEPAPHFEEVFPKFIEQVPENWDALYLAYGQEDRPRSGKEKIGPNCCRIWNPIWTAGYSLQRRGLEVARNIHPTGINRYGIPGWHWDNMLCTAVSRDLMSAYGTHTPIVRCWDPNIASPNSDNVQDLTNKKRGILVVGPESSGSRYMTRLLTLAGGDNPEWGGAPEWPRGAGEFLVRHRTVPNHKGELPTPDAEARQFSGWGSRLDTVVWMVRHPYAQLQSQLANGHSPIQTTVQRIMEIWAGSGVQMVLVPYESLSSVASRRALLQHLGLPAVDGEPFLDGNEKYYEA